MQTQNEDIKMYWWEGFYGFKNLFRRLAKAKRPYVKNFGDLLAPLIVSLISGKSARHSTSAGKLLSLGSIFFALSDKDKVWGSGFLNAKHVNYALACKDVSYLAVRGPETRRLLNQYDINCPETYGDPAILLPQLIKNDIAKKYAIGIVPHFLHFESMKSVIKDQNIKIINVENSLIEVMRDILSCEVILSSSLHGVIVAEAYDIPALLLINDQPLHGDLFKFEDYFHATNRTLSFAQFDSSKLNALADAALNQKKPYYNRNKLLDAFPYKINNLNLNSPIFGWRDLNLINSKRSLVPPRYSVL